VERRVEIEASIPIYIDAYMVLAYSISICIYKVGGGDGA